MFKTDKNLPGIKLRQHSFQWCKKYFETVLKQSIVTNEKLLEVKQKLVFKKATQIKAEM